MEYVYRKNPNFGQPGELEMLAPEIVEGITVINARVGMDDFKAAVQSKARALLRKDKIAAAQLLLLKIGA